ncbi:hypothetical protein E8E14_002904 [Neopestalotiopsis sp. 37M]|nr:hypothetical protein E8E14_002904 [Neopestalotiopsis sp. 37M]
MADNAEKSPVGSNTLGSSDGVSVENIIVDKVAERSYVKKLDFYLLPFLSLMYFFNSVDRSNLGNAQTDGLGNDLGFVGNQYSLLILLFYIPNGLCDLPLNMLTKRFSGKVMLPGLMFAWGAMALFQNAAKNFAGLLIKNTSLHGWQWLFIIEGALTVLIAIIGYFWLPASSSTAWFLTDHERTVARLRSLRDASGKVDTDFSMKECFQQWNDWKFPLWCVIAFTYPVAFATCANFLPIVLQRLGYSTVVTNLLTVPPNCCGFIVLLIVTYWSDRLRERTYHIVFSLTLSLVGLIILATVDGLTHRGVAYFACFLLASGAYIPSCLVQSWHNNNNLNENSRAANTGFLVGLGNLGGILAAATFRTDNYTTLNFYIMADQRFPNDMKESEVVGHLATIAKNSSERRVSEGKGGINGPSVVAMSAGHQQASYAASLPGADVSDPKMKDLPKEKQDQWNNQLSNLSKH